MRYDRFVKFYKMIGNFKGHKHSEKSKIAIRDAKIGENNPSWKGDLVGLSALHEWIKNRKPRPSFCENCKKRYPIDLANISQNYKRDLSDWEWLCRKCHMIKDGRLEMITSRIKSVPRLKGKQHWNFKHGKYIGKYEKYKK